MIFKILPYRLHYKRRTRDSIDYEGIEKTDFWVEEEAPPQEQI